jgi:hypothetical protein
MQEAHTFSKLQITFGDPLAGLFNKHYDAMAEDQRQVTER